MPLRTWQHRTGRAALASIVLAGLLAAAPAAAEAELILEDGQVLRGESVERKEDLYLLELESGSVLPIPVELVLQLRLTGEGDEDQAVPSDVDPFEEVDPADEQDDAAPTGIRTGEPQVLAGPPEGVDPPASYEQLAVFEEPARFRHGVIDPTWRPNSEWGGPATDVTQFNPVEWYRSPIDPRWSPTPAYTRGTDVTSFDPADWYQAPIRSNWWPSDGWSSFDDDDDED